MNTQSHTPDYYHAVMPYLVLNDLDQFLEFTKNVFGAVEMMKDKDDSGRIVHTEIVIGDSTIMAGKSTDQWKIQPASLFIIVDSADETYRQAVKAGAKTIMELSGKEYGRTCGVKDSNGNTWWITSQSQN